LASADWAELQAPFANDRSLTVLHVAWNKAVGGVEATFANDPPELNRSSVPVGLVKWVVRLRAPQLTRAEP